MGGLACLEGEFHGRRAGGCALMAGRSFSWRLFRLKGLLLKKAVFFFGVCFSSSLLGGALFTGLGGEALTMGLGGDGLFIGFGGEAAFMGLGGAAGFMLTGCCSTLDIEVGFDTSLWESRLDGRYALVAELRSEGGPGRQNMVMPSVG